MKYFKTFENYQYDEDGYDDEGFNEDGYNKEGYDINGYTEDENDEDGDDGFNEDDYNETALAYANKYYRDSPKDGAYGDFYEVLERLDEFCTTDFPYGIQNIPETVILYRLLNIENEKAINKDELGTAFVGDKDMYDDYDFVESFMHRYGEEQKRWFIITVETSKDNINMSSTLGNRAEYPAEHEITLTNDKNLKILNIEEVDPR